MSTLLPTAQADDLRQALTDYLTTTFALADADARTALTDFLTDPATGIFKGPWTRLKIPFAPAVDGWQHTLDWMPDGFVPYAHQAAAFARLSTRSDGDEPLRPPEPTIVTTGTGSGKTESFLYPILDHVLRARSLGIRGTKALILYPMNALANDQAGRLTELITGDPRLAKVTAAIYTGDQQSGRTLVSERGLITDRAVIRDDPPDILLSNYKMLDQLLLRHDDRRLWTASADSLTYLVLDEFHTYDGAQGTDVAMLLRRLGLILAQYRSDSGDDDSGAALRQAQGSVDLGEEAVLRQAQGTEGRESGAEVGGPLGSVTPIATSATLGDGGDPAAMINFARTVFGTPIDSSAVITEHRLDVEAWAEQWTGPDPITTRRVHAEDADAALETLDSADDPDTITETVVDQFLPVETENTQTTVKGRSPKELAAILLAAPQIRDLLREGHRARSLDELARAMISTHESAGPVARWTAHLIAALSHLRGALGRDFVDVETHLWIRELTRLDRLAASNASFRWSDDGQQLQDFDEAADQAKPAVYCRHCGRSGWGIYLEPTGTTISMRSDVRTRHRNRERYFRALIHAANEAEAGHLDDLAWWDTRHGTLNRSRPDTDSEDYLEGRILPVLTHARDEEDAAGKDDCPSCLGRDGIRFLGSAVATQLSVSLSALFGSAGIDTAEKKALVFTDSVQDAAHRAGFVQARSHTLTLRSAIAESVSEDPMTLDDLATAMLRDAGNDPFRRHRLLHPELIERPRFRQFWEEPRTVDASLRRDVGSRVLFDLALEFGLQSRFGRTLETTGAMAAAVDAGTEAQLVAAARRVLATGQRQQTLDGEPPSDTAVVAWVRGVLEHMRSVGAIHHDWLRGFLISDGSRWKVWGGRPRSEGMPAFPPGRSTPTFPRVGPASTRRGDPLLENATSAQGWYARWAQRTLGVTARVGATLTRLLLEELDEHGVLISVRTDNSVAISATSYAIPYKRVLVEATTDADLRDRRHLLRCDICHAEHHSNAEVVGQLAGAPCLLVRCAGHLQPQPMAADNYYRRLYRTPDMRRIVAREHTGLLPAEIRLDYEDGFKQADAVAGAPNVLVATPTLEMGIDIGSLSTVLLSSLPRTVASYLQRVGRAGRLTGNALDLTYVTGHRRNLPRLNEPTSMINGAVRPPATWLSAEEILRRQYFAHVVDRIAGRDDLQPPRRASDVLGTQDPNGLLHRIRTFADENATELLETFLSTFDELRPDVVDRLRIWATPAASGSSPLTDQLRYAADRWAADGEGLKRRRDQIQQALPELEQRAELPQPDDEDVRAYRAARAAYGHLKRRLADRSSQYWISALEEAGLLPNYTLLDDSVTLDVVVTWLDPDTQAWQQQDSSLSRPSARALGEFAPGSRFYAHGMEIKIDAVDLGADGDAVRPWAFCAECGWATESTTPTACPRCGSTSPTDAGQRLSVVELTSVSAQMQRDEAMIGDSTDERGTSAYTLVACPDIDERHVTQQWAIDHYDFGVRYLNRLPIRWLNLGRRGTGASWQVAGEQATAPLFRVCRGCGVQDRQAQDNRPDEHRPWCSYRRATGEAHVETIALSRTLQTQGVVISLPTRVTLGDSYAVPSLTAALLLGLLEQFGGDPDHLGVFACTAPSLDGHNRDALLLHDLVPGGTGYLADLAQPDQFWRLIHRAWQIVRDCPCAGEEQLSCHRCLLPFAGDVARVSRAAAERHLEDILTVGGTLPEPGPDSQWAVTAGANPLPDDGSSWLERRFYQAFHELAEDLSARVVETPGMYGNRMQLRLPGQDRSWTLEPQVLMQGSRPDFVLRSDDAQVPTMAIFTDGRSFHASATNNNLADDAAKRADLSAAGVFVLAVTARDVAAQADGKAPAPPRWWSESDMRPMLVQHYPKTSRVLDNIADGPFGTLRRWLSGPDSAAQSELATWLPLALLGRYRAGAAAGDLGERATAMLAGDDTEPHPSGGWSEDGVGVAVRRAGNLIACSAVIDDRPDRLVSDAARHAWHDWLALSNVLQLSNAPLTVGAFTGLADASAPVLDVTPVDVQLPDAWVHAYDECVTDEERKVIVDLAHAGAPVATIGEEIGSDQVPVDLSWPDRRLAVFLDSEDAASEQAETLRRDGWTVLTADVDKMMAALNEGAGR